MPQKSFLGNLSLEQLKQLKRILKDEIVFCLRIKRRVDSEMLRKKTEI